MKRGNANEKLIVDTRVFINRVQLLLKQILGNLAVLGERRHRPVPKRPKRAARKSASKRKRR